MKTPEEIEKLALKAYPKRIGDPYNPQEDLNEEDRLVWLEGYKQCQEDVLVEGIDTLFVEGYNQCQNDNANILNECVLQLEYLNEKFGETGTTNALLSKLKSLNK